VSAAEPVGQRVERGFRFPRHVGIAPVARIACAALAVEHLDHAGARHVEIDVRVVAVREVVARERVHKRGIDALGGEHVQQLTQIDRLFVLVADVLAVQSGGGTIVVPHDGRVDVTGHIARTAVRGAPELGGRDGLPLRAPLRDERARSRGNSRRLRMSDRRHSVKLILAALVVSGLASSLVSQQATPAQHDAHSDDLGTNNFATSCTPAAHAEFQRGVAMLHSYWFGYAGKTFRSVLEKDPGCAIAYWGLALDLLGNTLSGPPSRPNADAAWKLLEEARGIPGKTDREAAWLEAIRAHFRNHDSVPVADRLVAYNAEMKEARVKPGLDYQLHRACRDAREVCARAGRLEGRVCACRCVDRLSAGRRAYPIRAGSGVRTKRRCSVRTTRNRGVGGAEAQAPGVGLAVLGRSHDGADSSRLGLGSAGRLLEREGGRRHAARRRQRAGQRERRARAFLAAR
jgi:hypothetical protein